MSPQNASFPSLLTSDPVDILGLGGKPQVCTGKGIPASLQDIVPSFIEHALRSGGVIPAQTTVTAVRLEHTAVSGLLSTTGRATITYGESDALHATPPPPTVIVKLQAEGEASRAMAIGADNYATEALAYRKFTADMGVGTPACFHIAHDEHSGNYVFVMEDLSSSPSLYAVSQFDGNACSRGEAEAVAHALGKLHAQYWTDSSSVSSLLRHTHDIEARDVELLVKRDGEQFIKSAYYTQMDDATREVVDGVLPKAADLMASLREGPQTLLHHDCRADNLFWGHPTAPAGVVFIDWQMLGQGVGALDLAWFAAGSFLDLDEPDRLGKHQRLVSVYWRSLIAAGVDESKFPFEAAWRDYVLGIVWSFLVCVQIVNFGTPNPTLISFVGRHAAALLELDVQNVPFERIAQ